MGRVLEIKTGEPQLPVELYGTGENEPCFVAQALWDSVESTFEEGESLAIAITGSTGVGKTTIANMIANKITGSQMAVETDNGKEVGVQKVRDMMMNMHDSSIFSVTGHRCWIINEGDNISDDGQTAFLSLLDEMPSRFHVMVTSNEQLDDWSERFHSRFEVWPVSPPQEHEVIEGLIKRMNVHPRVAELAVEQCGGNVRQAIMEIKAWKRKNKK